MTLPARQLAEERDVGEVVNDVIGSWGASGDLADLMLDLYEGSGTLLAALAVYRKSSRFAESPEERAITKRLRRYAEAVEERL